MTDCLGTPYLKLLQLQINRDISFLKIRPDLIVGGFLNLFVEESKYQPTTSGSPAEYRPTGNGSFQSISLVRKGFTANLDYSETAVKRAVHLISGFALSRQQDVIIRDFVSPEPEHELFTERRGSLIAITFAGNITLPTTGVTLTPGGFSVTFSERDLRFI
jgi:hypothetical protein